jgi:hypothetical protein
MNYDDRRCGIISTVAAPGLRSASPLPGNFAKFIAPLAVEQQLIEFSKAHAGLQVLLSD